MNPTLGTVVNGEHLWEHERDLITFLSKRTHTIFVKIVPIPENCFLFKSMVSISRWYRQIDIADAARMVRQRLRVVAISSWLHRSVVAPSPRRRRAFPVAGRRCRTGQVR